MSRIGKKPIEIPSEVEVKLDMDLLIVKGPKGELKIKIHPNIKIEIKDKVITVQPKMLNKKTGALWGTFRSLVDNMIQGVIKGFEKKLEIQGVGYRASLEKNKLTLNLGFSHLIEIEAPEGISFNVEKNIITISGINKQLVGQIAANIRAKRKPEPYKGKGIRYQGELVRRKAGKKAVASE